MIISFSGTTSSLVSVYYYTDRLQAVSLPNHVWRPCDNTHPSLKVRESSLASLRENFRRTVYTLWLKIALTHTSGTGEQDRQRAYNVTTVAVELISTAYSECVCAVLSYPTCKAHVPYYSALCGLSGSTIFFALSHKGTFFGGKNYWTRCVSISPFILLYDTFLVLRRIQRHIINVHKSSYKCPQVFI
jgi:hypothetical protein